MYDELIKRLRRCASYDPRFVIQDCEDAADAIEELQQITTHYEEESKGWWLCACDAKEERERLKEQIPKWIPVTERLPEDYEQVLTCDGRGNIHMFSHNRLFQYPFGIKPENPRYFMPKWWMPLPQPPETEN